jgi:hypothetical protein
MKVILNLLAVAILVQIASPAWGQGISPAAPTKTAPLMEQGRVNFDGHSTSYIIRHLPVSSFPELPTIIADLLNKRGCTVPQTYEAHQPENVVHASLAQAGSSDWAVLCSAQGTVSLLVFFNGNTGQVEATPMVLASSPETQRLQPHDPGGILGFNWGIDPATPEQVHEAQSGLKHRPAQVDHDALADSTVEHRTIYHFYAKSNWFLLDTAE